MSIGSRTLSAVVLLLVHSTAVPSQGRGPALAGGIPKLQLAFTTHDADDSPRSHNLPLCVSESGAVLFVSNSSSDERLAVADSTGRIVRRFGRQGDGPGEVRSAEPVAATRAGYTTWDPTLARLSEWGSSGQHLRSIAIPTGIRPSVEVPGGYLGAQRNGRGWRPVLIDKATGQGREMLKASDTLFDIKPSPIAGAPFVSPVFGIWADGFLVGNANEYTLTLYRWDGQVVRTLSRTLKRERTSAGRVEAFLRVIPNIAQRPAGEIARLREQASGMMLPYFTPGGVPSTDADGRLWVLGVAADSGFADVFSADRFLGRIALACRGYQGSFSVKGNWLALACLPDNPAFDGDAVIKLFRIVG